VSSTGRAPRVCVLIPCRDEAELVAEAVASIVEAEPVHVIVVDDASSDERSLSVLEDLRAVGIEVVRLDENVGCGAARTVGLARCDAPYVFALDADDLAEAEVLAEMADRLDADPGAAACVGDILEFGTHTLVRAVPTRLDPFRVAYTNEFPACALFRRTTLDAVGGWQPMTGYEDWNLWMDLAERGERIVHLGPGRIGYRRRLHGPRLDAAAKTTHAALYRAMRAGHPALFGSLREHRRQSDLSPIKRLLFPLVYGARARWPFEERVKPWADRLGWWTGARRP
jgi:glycosyltransferase involved in cell wall biosynthesis